MKQGPNRQQYQLARFAEAAMGATAARRFPPPTAYQSMPPQPAFGSTPPAQNYAFIPADPVYAIPVMPTQPTVRSASSVIYETSLPLSAPVAGPLKKAIDQIHKQNEAVELQQKIQATLTPQILDFLAREFKTESKNIKQNKITVRYDVENDKFVLQRQTTVMKKVAEAPLHAQQLEALNKLLNPQPGIYSSVGLVQPPTPQVNYDELQLKSTHNPEPADSRNLPNYADASRLHDEEAQRKYGDKQAQTASTAQRRPAAVGFHPASPASEPVKPRRLPPTVESARAKAAALPPPLQLTPEQAKSSTNVDVSKLPPPPLPRRKL